MRTFTTCLNQGVNVFLDGNRFTCDCDMMWLGKFLDANYDYRHFIDSATCCDNYKTYINHIGATYFIRKGC
ncbi:Uncharacterised protein g11370 [Pycnogonum litorale]